MTLEGSEPNPAELDSEEQAVFLDTQGISDSDQTLADRDQTLSDHDQSASERDQMASDSDQAAADRDFAAHTTAGTPADLPDYHLSRIQRLSGTSIRHETRDQRTMGAAERDRISLLRDDNSALRDEVADRLDLIRETTDVARSADSAEARKILEELAQIRSRASSDRSQAAKDRARAAVNRRQAAIDRKNAEIAFQASLASSPGGALNRGAGDIALENQIRQARMERHPLTVIDLAVDGDRADVDENNREINGILERIKEVLPEGNPVVRNGDSGFIFAIEGDDQGEARLKDILEDLDFDYALGKAEMDDDDTFSTLIDKAQKRRLAEQEGNGESEG